MKRAFAALAVMAILASAAPASAQSDPSTPKPKEKKTCRSLTPTGSFLPTRVCNTEAEWSKFDGSNQEGLSDFRRALNMTSTNERRSRN